MCNAIIILFITKASLLFTNGPHYRLRFSIILSWYETDRVSYNNLKPIVRVNALSSEEMSQIWTPYAIYANTDQNETVEFKTISKMSKQQLQSQKRETSPGAGSIHLMK